VYLRSGTRDHGGLGLSGRVLSPVLGTFLPSCRGRTCRLPFEASSPLHQRFLPPAAFVGVAALSATLAISQANAAPSIDAAEIAATAAGTASEEPVPEIDPDLTVIRLDDPARTVLEDGDGEWVATFTEGSYTVAVAGAERTFDEPTATAVTTTEWVRLLPAPFDGEIDVEWFEQARTDVSADVLEIATEYWEGAADVWDEDGILVSAEAAYGPLQPDGSRPVGSDWHDFKGIDAEYDGRIDPAKPEEYRALDCSGYTRTIFGERLGLPMSLRPDGGTSIPRRSFEQAADAPGVVPIADGVVDADLLQAGDLVFFDSPSDDDGRIDHVGIYLGVDEAGDLRFVHSRRSANGPTMGGDDVSPSILNGDGYYDRGFESTRRL
jgi:cell wall-associated NlpC family hydrolase